MSSKKTLFGKEIPKTVLRMLRKMMKNKKPVPTTNFKRSAVEQALARMLVYQPVDGQLALTSAGRVAAKI